MSADDPESLGPCVPSKTSVWRVIKRVLVALVLWYGAVLLWNVLGLRPPFEGQSAMSDAAGASLYVHRLKVAEGRESFADVNGSETLRYAASGPRSFLSQTIASDTGVVDALVAYPRSEIWYKRSLVGRILFLDSDHHHLPTYLLTRDGVLYRGEGFDASPPPTAADIALRDSASAGNPWHSGGPLPTTLPAPPTRPASTSTRAPNPVSESPRQGQDPGQTPD